MPLRLTAGELDAIINHLREYHVVILSEAGRFLRPPVGCSANLALGIALAEAKFAAASDLREFLSSIVKRWRPVRHLRDPRPEWITELALRWAEREAEARSRAAAAVREAGEPDAQVLADWRAKFEVPSFLWPAGAHPPPPDVTPLG